MKSFRKVLSTPLVAALLVLGAARMASASSGPKWSTEQLADFSAAIVTGRVAAINCDGTDSNSDLYVCVARRDEVLKGSLTSGQVIEAGRGIAGDIG